MNYSWNAKNPDIKKAESLSSELQISPFLSKLLVNRDISSHEEAYEFLNPYLKKNDGSLNLPNPFLLKGMEESVQRIIQAIERVEKILYLFFHIWVDHYFIMFSHNLFML